jgi:hypothetical protein
MNAPTAIISVPKERSPPKYPGAAIRMGAMIHDRQLIRKRTERR